MVAEIQANREALVCFYVFCLTANLWAHSQRWDVLLLLATFLGEFQLLDCLWPLVCSFAAAQRSERQDVDDRMLGPLGDVVSSLVLFFLFFGPFSKGFWKANSSFWWFGNEHLDFFLGGGVQWFSVIFDVPRILGLS